MNPSSVFRPFQLNRLKPWRLVALAGALTLPFLASSAQAQVRPVGFLPDDFTIDHPDYGTSTGADVYFAATNGASTNTGRTTSSPWPLNYAIENVPAGSVIKVRGGTYYLPAKPLSGGERQSPKLAVRRQMTIQAYGTEQPWIKGSTVVPTTSWTKDGAANRWYTDSTPGTLTTYEYPPTSDPRAVADYAQAADREQVYLTPNGGRSKPLVQIGDNPATTGVNEGLSTLGAGEFYVDRTAHRIYLGEDPATKKLEVTSADDGLSLYGGSLVGTKIRGLGFMHFAERAVNVVSLGVIVEDCSIVWNGRFGLRMAGDNGLAGSIFRNNNVACNGEEGVNGQRPADAVVRDNLIQRNNVESTNTSWAAAGAKFVGGSFGDTNFSFLHNTVINNYGTGVWLDEGCDKVKVVGNTTRNNGVGIFFEISRTAIIAFNFLDGDTVLIANARDARIYNNTFINFSAAIVVKKGGRTNDHDFEQSGTAPGAVYGVDGNVIQNNLFSNGESGADKFMIDTATSTFKEPSKNMVPTSNFNGYFRPGGNPTNVVRWRASDTAITTETFTSVANFHAAHSGYELPNHSTESTVTPFVNFAGGDYRPASIATGKGAAVPADILDGALTPDNKVPDLTPEHYGAFNAPNAAPTVSLTSPLSGTRVIGAPASFSVTANASDSDSTIARVEFYSNGSTTPFDTENIAPYETTWSNVPAGTHTISARAFDNDGAASLLDSATVSVKARISAVNAGGPAAGVFAADVPAAFSASTVYAASTPPTVTTTGVTDPAPLAVYQSERYGTGDFTYTKTGLAPNAAHTVRLHFAETYPGIVTGSRVFNISVTGAPALNNFDIYAAAGGSGKTIVREFAAVSNAAGTIVVSFGKQSNLQNPKINGIEIIK